MPALPGGRGRSRVAGACVTGRRLGDVKAVKLGKVDDRPVKLVELDAILAVPEGYGDDVPVEPDFHARRLPDSRLAARHGVGRGPRRLPAPPPARGHGAGRLHALRGRHAEHRRRVRHRRARSRSWRWSRRGSPRSRTAGRGCSSSWMEEPSRTGWKRPAVQERLTGLLAGHERWLERRKRKRPFPGGPYILLHTLSHLLLQSLSMTLRVSRKLDQGAHLRRRPGAPVRHPALHRNAGRRGHARRAGPGGAPHRAAPRARAATGRALLQRPHLRAARARSEPRGALAARRRVSRLHIGRGDVLRDAQRLPGSRPGHPVLGLRDAAFFTHVDERRTHQPARETSGTGW